jgi:exonuclease SbcD
LGIRFLHLADTHLGQDLPRRRRTPGWRRGDDIVAAFQQALGPARRGEVDLVLHCGDLFDRSRPPGVVIDRALAALLPLAGRGVDVVIVPGNHERGRLPDRLLFEHPRVHVLDHPRTVRIERNGFALVIAGFPFRRHDAAEAFPGLLAATGWRAARGDARILALHQTVAGAVVGPGRYRFRPGPDVIRPGMIPAEFDYVALGHVHPHQALRHPRSDGPELVYAGSTERMSYCEAGEPKGVVLGEIDRTGVSWRFQEQPCRPMISARFTVADPAEAARVDRRVTALLRRAPQGAMVRLGIHDPLGLLEDQLAHWRELGRHCAELVLRC